MKVVLERSSKNVAQLIINRPERKNAVDFDVIEEFQQHLNVLKNDDDLSILIIRGKGDTFCSGGDLHSFHQLITKEEALTMLKPMSQVLKTIVSLPMITISYLNGTAVGGGAELASATDLRIGKKGGKVGFIQGGLHITTGWGGASLLKKRIGLTNALFLLCSGRKITMEEAKTIGFVQHIVDDGNDLYHFIDEFFTADVLRQYKRNLFTEKERNDLFLAMDKEVEACASLWEKEEHHLAVKAFLSKKG